MTKPDTVCHEDAHRSAVRAFVLRLTGEEALAEDLTQETLIRAEKARGKLRKKSAERSWLCSIALNLVRDHYRASARAPETASDPAEILGRMAAPEDTEHALLAAEMSSCVAEYVFRLPEAQREVVALFDMAGFDHKEIGETLGISQANSRVLLHRGRAALREMLEGACILNPNDPIPCERKPGCE